MYRIIFMLSALLLSTGLAAHSQTIDSLENRYKFWIFLFEITDSELLLLFETFLS